MNRIISSILFSGALATVFLCASCTNKPPNLAPLGPISATGTLIPSEVSLIRRGTHILLIRGMKAYYVESKTENLVDYEGQTVHILGVAEENTPRDDLPVLVVTKLTSAGDSGKTHAWEVPALDIRIVTPENWVASIQKSVVTFTAERESRPLLTVRLSESGSLPPGGRQEYLAGHRAVRMEPIGMKGTIDVYVQGKEHALWFHFDATSQSGISTIEELKLLQGAFDHSLSTLQFLSDQRDNTVSTGSGAMEGCGGFANVLCPQGSFCNIVNEETKMGTCRSIPKL